MNDIYIEVLNVLEYILRELENNWWHNVINKSIIKYNENKDTSCFLGSFGGRGLNDEPIKYGITDVLVSLAYTIATKIKNNKEYNFYEILFEKLDFYTNRIQYINNNKPYFRQERELEKAKESLAYISYLIGNYKEDNLMEITLNYLTPELSIRKR